MRCNIYKDALQRAELFGKPVLYTGLPIERESIPENWYCYDLTGSDRNPTKPVTLEDRAVWNRVGSVLSPVPLKRETIEIASRCTRSCWIWRASARKTTWTVPVTLENMCCAPLLPARKRGCSIPWESRRRTRLPER